MRGGDAYPRRMALSTIPGPRAQKVSPPLFVACTGDVTSNLLNTRDTNYQLSDIHPQTEFITLSLGGNDVKFADILQKCIFGIGPGDCSTMMQKARDILYDTKQDGFFYRYQTTVDQILAKMLWHTRDPTARRTAIYVTSYPAFFEDWTDQCDKISFLISDLSMIGPKVTKDLRSQMNYLMAEFSFVTQYWLDVHNYRWTALRYADYMEPERLGNPINVVDLDFVYAGHRFCDEGVTEPDKKNADTWFFHLSLRDTMSRLLDDPKTRTRAKNTISAVLHNEKKGADAVDGFVDIMKSFHPTSGGHQATADHIVQNKLSENILNSLSDKSLFITVIGDDLPCGGLLPSRNEKFPQGFVTELERALSNKQIYDGSPWVQFQGSQQTRPDAQPTECYPGKYMSDFIPLMKQITKNWKQSDPQRVVLLSVGVLDLMQDGADHAPSKLIQQLDTLIDMIEQQDDKKRKGDPDRTVVLVGQIPMIGYNTPDMAFTNTFDPLQGRVIEYNARITQLVNRLRTQSDMYIAKVRASTTTYEHIQDSDSPGYALNQAMKARFPSPFGYKRLAYDYLEALAIAASEGWLDDAGSCGV